MKELKSDEIIAEPELHPDLKSIYDYEKDHKQWGRHGSNVAVFLCLIFLQLWRGNKAAPSLFGIETCSAGDWIGQIVYIGISFVIVVFAVRKAIKEQEIKEEHGKGVREGEVKMSGGSLVKLLGFSLIGGFVSGALGLGGGAIFNPLLLSMGCPPTVASSTGMYMIIFSTGATTIIYLLNGVLDYQYGLWVGAFCIMGTFLGMWMLNKFLKKLNRQSPLVFLLSFMFVISTIAVPVFGADKLKGIDNLWAFKNFCNS